MSFLPEGASFEELVQDYFVALRGSGLMLSPLDGELVSAWAAQGVPFEVVARGIRRAAEAALWDARPGEPALRSVRACRKAVEVEVKKYLARSAGAHAEGDAAAALEEDREKKRGQALRKFAREHPELAELVERAARAAERAAPERREDAMLLLAARLLPYQRRVEVVREARAQLEATEVLSPRARRLARRFHLTAAARRALALPAFW
jgi:hypothetical protein